MSVPVSENQKNQRWALIGWRGLKSLFAKAISCEERSAKLGFGVLFNAGRLKKFPSSFAQPHKAGNQSSLTPLMQVADIPLSRISLSAIRAGSTVASVK